MLLGKSDQGHKEYIAPALLHHLEHLPTHILDIQTMFETGSSMEENIIKVTIRFLQIGTIDPSRPSIFDFL